MGEATRVRLTASGAVALLVVTAAVSLSVGVTAASHAGAGPAADPTAFSCDPFAYLFKNQGVLNPSDVLRVDLASGESTTAGQLTDTVNAVGYNVLDDYMYAWDLTTKELVRISNDLSLTQLGVPTGIADGDITDGFQTGDVDSSGHYWVLNGNKVSTTIYEIDLTVSPPAVLQSIPVTLTGEVKDISDWAFIDGALYGMSSLTAGASSHLLKFDPATAAFADLGAVSGVPGSDVYGAAYADSTDRLFVSDNSTGDIYRINIAATTGQLVAAGPPSAGNDGARCAKAPIATITTVPTIPITEEQPVPSANGGLATTGGDAQLQLIAAGLLLAGGALLSLAGRRRRNA